VISISLYYVFSSIKDKLIATVISKKHVGAFFSLFKKANRWLRGYGRIRAGNAERKHTLK
jgi:hypothetical protein